MDFTFNIHMDSNVDGDLPCQLLADSVTKRAYSNKMVKLNSASSSFNLPVIAGYLTCLALFSTQWVCLVFIVYHFVLFCRPGIKTI